MTEPKKTAEQGSGADLATAAAPPSALATSQTRREVILENLTWPARRAGWAIQKNILWPTADALRRLADVATWPFERVIWAFRTRVAWPVQDKLSERGRPVRTAIAVSAVGIAVAASGAVALNGDSGDSPPLAQKSSVLAAAEIAYEPDGRDLLSRAELSRPAKPAGPVLLGVAPNFKVAGAPADGTGSGDSLNAGANGGTINTKPVPGESADSGSALPGGDSLAKANVPEPDKVKPALNVSRQFADAFVLYEIGQGDAGVKTTFKETAAEPLVRALNKRPPRQPKGVKVPKARVLNVVPGPRKGKSLSVSVALVRLGTSSELRLRLRHDRKTGWRVSDVRG